MTHRTWLATVWVSAPEDYEADDVKGVLVSLIDDDEKGPLVGLTVYTPREDARLTDQEMGR